MKPTALCCA
jgi:hypothetical protein